MQAMLKQTGRSYTPDGVSYVWTLPADSLGKYWPTIAKFLLMIEQPEWSLDEVFEQLSDRRAQLWAIVTNGEIKGIWVTKIMQNTAKYGLVWIAAGESNNQVSLSDGLKIFLTCTESWFKEKGCQYVKIIGRKGWKKALPDYQEHAIELRKQL